MLDDVDPPLPAAETRLHVIISRTGKRAVSADQQLYLLSSANVPSNLGTGGGLAVCLSGCTAIKEIFNGWSVSSRFSSLP